MDSVCVGKQEMNAIFWLEVFEGISHCGDFGVKGQIILNCN